MIAGHRAPTNLVYKTDEREMNLNKITEIKTLKCSVGVKIYMIFVIRSMLFNQLLNVL